ncbi:MAG: helix-turn-helix transcriptional regulator [Clostridia bacterium]|nr:helix-turn-helix transcriptional regulator [Clostridia bacterium]
MEDLKITIANNLTYLRKKHNFTQLELAEKINYSDNAISRWERGEVTPGIEILQLIAKFYSISVNDLLDENLPSKKDKGDNSQKITRTLTTIFSLSVLWSLLIVIYIYLQMFNSTEYWMLFVYGVPLTFAIIFYFNRRWGNRLTAMIMSSLFTWTMLVSVYLQFLDYNLWLIFFLGIPSQSGIVTFYFLKPKI